MSLRKDEMESPEAPPSSFTAGPVGWTDVRAKSRNHDGRNAEGCVLYQASFFLCTVKMVGDIPGGGPLYVETVVDRDSGISFAKVYSERNSINGVDILASRVFPYFCKQGVPVREVRTRKTSEYCGLAPRHAYETFLACSHIGHALAESGDDPCYYLCEQFYWFLAREFFQPMLRTAFEISLAKLQKKLDEFLETFNSGKRLRENVALAAATP